MVWHTTTQAWNCAVQNTLGAEASSVVDLPFSAPIGLYEGSATDALLPFEIQGRGIGEPLFSPMTWATSLLWDPADLQWNEIRDAIKKTAKTRDAVRVATDEGAAQALRDHAEAIAPCFDGPVLPDRPWVWLSVAGIGIIIGASLGGIPGAILGAVGAPRTYDTLDRLLRAGQQKFVMATVLREVADRIETV